MAKTSLKNLSLNKPSLFTPTVNRLIADPSSGFNQFVRVDGQINSDTNIDSSSSFRYALPGQGLKSTQQLNVDWSQFANHTFYHSAQVKTNVAFDKVFNRYPFDGTKQELEKFFDGLSGYEKWVYDQHPKYKGYLFLSGTAVSQSSGGTFVTIRDSAGAAYQTVSRKTTGTSVLSPMDSSVTIEFYVYLPEEANQNSVVFDKHSESGSDRNGLYVAVSQSAASTYASMSFYALSGTVYDSVSVPLTKGQWEHVAFVWDRTPGIFSVRAYVNGVFQMSSSMPVEFGQLFESSSNAYIGSGSAVTGLFTPVTTFSGALDEFRIWHSARTEGAIKESMQKAIFASASLKLYYRFDEPSGSNSAIVIDHSANSLHGRLSTEGLLLGVREMATGSVAGPDPMVYQKLEFSPVLFANQTDVGVLQTRLLTSASAYDIDNPSLITRLIPRHYLIEGKLEEGFESVEGQIVDELTSGTDPRSSKLGGTQLFLLVLYTWAQFFDEIKLFTQAFSDLNFVDYDSDDTIPDQFLMQLARSQGIELPPLFVGASAAQFLDAENVGNQIGTNTLSLQYIQNQIWRRILVNLRHIVATKGTLEGIKAFVRSVGIDPDNNFRIREFGGPTKRPLGWTRDSRSEVSTMLDFVSGGLITSPYLSSSKVEPGFPQNSTAGTANNGYLTSGSWTYEGTYRFIPAPMEHPSQSLVRFMTTGSLGRMLMLNVVAVSGSNIVNLYVRPENGVSADALTTYVTGADIFDGNKWYVSTGRLRSDDPVNVTTSASASYFLRVAKANYGEILESYVTASLRDEHVGSFTPVWEVRNSFSNASGSWFEIGSGSLATGGGRGLNYAAGSPATARTVFFDGKVGHVRFWSKYLEDEEWKEHVRNYRSLGVQEPSTNFSFVTYKSGSWQRLRIDASTDQITTASNGTGEISVFDFSQNNFHLTGTLFSATSSVIVPERFYFSYISPKFDEAATTKKVRVRSFEDYDNVLETEWAQVAPVYDLPRSELPYDSSKFSIDFSIVDALDQDIASIFATLDELEHAIGNPELLYSSDYPGLDALRQVYFNRLTDRMNFRLFFDFFKWFDTNIGTFIAQLLPRKTKFLGTNYVIESHMLERFKAEYRSSDIYLGESNRDELKGIILLSAYEGSIKRY